MFNGGSSVTEVEFTNVISAVQINEVVKLASRLLGTEPLQFDFKAKFNGVSLHWKYRPLRKGNGRYIHAGRIPSSHKHRGVLIAGWYRGQTIPPEYGEGQRRGLLH